MIGQAVSTDQGTRLDYPPEVLLTAIVPKQVPAQIEVGEPTYFDESGATFVDLLWVGQCDLQEAEHAFDKLARTIFPSQVHVVHVNDNRGIRKLARLSEGAGEDKPGFVRFDCIQSFEPKKAPHLSFWVDNQDEAKRIFGLQIEVKHFHNFQEAIVTAISTTRTLIQPIEKLISSIDQIAKDVIEIAGSR